MSSKRMKCLQDGIFAKSTLKPIESVYNYNNEKEKIKLLISAGEWLTVSGLRRTGKTTLVRSTVSAMKETNTLYVDMWGVEEKREFDIFLERLRLEIKKIADRNRLKSILAKIESISFVGIKVDLRIKGEFTLIETLEKLSDKSKLVLILDEAQVALSSKKVTEFLASLHDRLAPNFSVIMVGSVVSMKNIISSKKVMPLYGRIGDEIVLEPLTPEKARNFLISGFEECGVSINEEIINAGVNIFGGFAGWLNWYGRRVVLELLSGKEIRPYNIIEIVEKEAQDQIYDEIARLLQNRKNIRTYLKIIKKTAIDEFVGISDLASFVKKDPSTVVFYLNHLLDMGLIKKEERYYTISDPMIKRLAKKPEFEKEVKIRI